MTAFQNKQDDFGVTSSNLNKDNNQLKRPELMPDIRSFLEKNLSAFCLDLWTPFINFYAVILLKLWIVILVQEMYLLATS